MRKFHDDAHANNRLSRCYIAIKNGDKYRISRIDSATLTEIHTVDRKTYKMDDNDIQFVFPKLGYVNLQTQCMYVTRLSRRMWKVGLTNENIHSTPMYPQFFGMADNINNHNILEKMMNDKYPSFRHSLLKVKAGKMAACAFAPKFCVGKHNQTKEPCIYYKNHYIGYYDADMEKIVISDTNSHMIQQLKEAINDDKVEILV